MSDTKAPSSKDLLRARFREYSEDTLRLLQKIIDADSKTFTQLKWPAFNLNHEKPLPYTHRFIRVVEGRVLPSLPLLADEIEHPQKFVDALEAFLNADIPEGNRSI